MLKKNFWKKKLDQFNKEEWEALCDRCGKCCLVKLEDEDDGSIHYTNISCELLCVKTGNCKDYKNVENLFPEMSCKDEELIHPSYWSSL